MEARGYYFGGYKLEDLPYNRGYFGYDKTREFNDEKWGSTRWSEVWVPKAWQRNCEKKEQRYLQF